MKRCGLIVLFLMLISVNFVNAAISIGEQFDIVDESTMVLGILFGIFALGINFGLSRGPMRYSKGRGWLAVLIALGLTYGVHKWWGGYYDFFNGVLFFIPEGLIEIVWPIVFLVFLVGSIVYLKKHALGVWGIFLIGGSRFAYESEIPAWTGGILILFWFILWLKGRKKKASDLGGGYAPQSYSNVPSATPSAPSSSQPGPGRLRRSGGWVKGKFGQMGKNIKYNRAHAAGLKENKARDQAKRKYNKMRDEASKENTARDRTKQMQIATKEQEKRKELEKYNKMRDEASKENTARDQEKQKALERQQTKKRISALKGEITKLNKKISKSTVIERGQIENRIRQLQKEMQGLSKI